MVKKSSSTSYVCKKSTPKITGTTRLLTTIKLRNILFSQITSDNSRCALIRRGSPGAVTRYKAGISSLVNVPFSYDKVSWCISDTADPKSNIMSVSTPPIVPGIIELDLTVATIIILCHKGLLIAGTPATLYRCPFLV